MITATNSSTFSNSLETWQSNMIEVGTVHAELIQNYQQDPNNPFDQDLASTYYDAEWVFTQIA